MKARIIKIGKTKGVRLPQSLLTKSGLTDEVQLDVAEGRITIRSNKRPRRGWANDFRRMAESGDDQLFRDEPLTRTTWDETQWQW